jgi:cation diffusion facilitator family transporter
MTSIQAPWTRVGQAERHAGDFARLEQRTLMLSLVCVVVIAVGSLAWGLAIESDVVILNGVFSLVSLIGSVLYLTAARLVTRPADRRFQYGYAHVEPMVNSVNGMLVLVICLYAFINGVEGLRAGGSEVDAASVIWFGAVSGLICAAVGTYEFWMSRRTGSQLLRNDAREWLIDASFSLATLVGFATLFVLEDPLRSTWARYADSALVAVLALLFLPIPLGVVTRNVRELLHMGSEDDAITGRVEAAMLDISREHDIRSHTTHVAKIGRSHLVEVNVVVGPHFELQTVAEQDGLRKRIWSAVGRPIDAAWLTINFTADPRWA